LLHTVPIEDRTGAPQTLHHTRPAARPLSLSSLVRPRRPRPLLTLNICWISQVEVTCCDLL
jgi:hypothetical protein